MKIFEKYIFKEILISYLFFTIIFNFLFVLLKLIDFTEKIINNSIPLLSAIKLSLLLIPSFSIFTIPLVALSSVLFTFSKLSSNSEIIALKTFGISTAQMSKAPLIIGLFSFFIGILNNIYILPFSTKVFFNEVDFIIKNQTLQSLKEKSFNSILTTTMFYFTKFDKTKNILEGILIYDEINKEPEVIIAHNGNINIQNNIIFLALKDGFIHLKKEDNQYEIISFKNYIVKFDIGKSLKNNINLKDKESSISEIQKRIIYYRKIKDFKKVNYLKMEIYKRYSLPFASTIFIFIGVIFGIKNSRNPKSWTFVVILGVVFLYYMLVMTMAFIVKSNLINPFLGAWLPNIVIGGFVGYLFWVIHKEKIRL